MANPRDNIKRALQIVVQMRNDTDATPKRLMIKDVIKQLTSLSEPPALREQAQARAQNKLLQESYHDLEDMIADPYFRLSDEEKSKASQALNELTPIFIGVEISSLEAGQLPLCKVVHKPSTGCVVYKGDSMIFDEGGWLNNKAAEANRIFFEQVFAGQCNAGLNDCSHED